MKKEQILKEIETLKEKWEIKSTNGRDYLRDSLINFSFNCKYNNLKKENQDYFLSEVINTPFIYEIFEQDFKETFLNSVENKDFWLKNKINLNNLERIDFKNVGFYGRSGGNFVLSFKDSDLYHNESGIFLKEIKERLKRLNDYIKITELFKEYMFNYFNQQTEYLKNETERDAKETAEAEALFNKEKYIFNNLENLKELVKDYLNNQLEK